jgi:hypothetical protein
MHGEAPLSVACFGTHYKPRISTSDAQVPSLQATFINSKGCVHLRCPRSNDRRCMRDMPTLDEACLNGYYPKQLDWVHRTNLHTGTDHQ